MQDPDGRSPSGEDRGFQDPSGFDPADPKVRGIRRIGAVILITVGIIWILQGLGIVPGSFMSNDPFWAVIGAICVACGVIVAWLSLRADPGPPKPPSEG